MRLMSIYLEGLKALIKAVEALKAKTVVYRPESISVSIEMASLLNSRGLEQL